MSDVLKRSIGVESRAGFKLCADQTPHAQGGRGLISRLRLRVARTWTYNQNADCAKMQDGRGLVIISRIARKHTEDTDLQLYIVPHGEAGCRGSRQIGSQEMPSCPRKRPRVIRRMARSTRAAHAYFSTSYFFNNHHRRNFKQFEFTSCGTRCKITES